MAWPSAPPPSLSMTTLPKRPALRILLQTIAPSQLPSPLQQFSFKATSPSRMIPHPSFLDGSTYRTQMGIGSLRGTAPETELKKKTGEGGVYTLATHHSSGFGRLAYPPCRRDRNVTQVRYLGGFLLTQSVTARHGFPLCPVAWWQELPSLNLNTVHAVSGRQRCK